MASQPTQLIHFTHPRKHKKAGMLPDAFQGDKRHRHTAMSADALERLGRLTPYSLNVTFQREKVQTHGNERWASTQVKAKDGVQNLESSC